MSSNNHNQTSILIRGGRLVNEDSIVRADLLIQNGKIASIQSEICSSDLPTDTLVIEACDQLIIPGGIDAETHFSDDALETYKSGTRAALIGGTTTVANFVKVDSNQSISNALQSVANKQQDLYCNVVLQPSVNFKGLEQIKRELFAGGDNSLSSDTAESTESAVKFNNLRLLTSQGEPAIPDQLDELYLSLAVCRKHGIVPSFVPQLDKFVAMFRDRIAQLGICGPEGHVLSRPEELEAAAVKQLFMMSELTHCPIHISPICSSKSCRVIASTPSLAASSLLSVSTTPAALAANCNFVEGDETRSTSGCHSKDWHEAANHVTCPPIICSKQRHLNQEHIEKDNTSSFFSSFVRASTQLAVAPGFRALICSQHCPLPTSSKMCRDFRNIPSSCHGVQERLAVAWETGVATGLVDPCQFVGLTSANPARLLNLYPQKGRLEVGCDADIVGIKLAHGGDGKKEEAEEKRRIISKENSAEAGDFSLFEGIRVSMCVNFVVINGQIALQPDSEPKAVGQRVSVRPHCSSDRLFQKANDAFLQETTHKWRAVQREPYCGPVVGDADKNKLASGRTIVASDYQRRELEKNTKEALPPGQRIIRTSVKTHQPPGGAGSSISFW